MNSAEGLLEDSLKVLHGFLDSSEDWSESVRCRQSELEAEKRESLRTI